MIWIINIPANGVCKMKNELTRPANLRKKLQPMPFFCLHPLSRTKACSQLVRSKIFLRWNSSFLLNPGKETGSKFSNYVCLFVIYQWSEYPTYLRIVASSSKINWLTPPIQGKNCNVILWRWLFLSAPITQNTSTFAIGGIELFSEKKIYNNLDSKNWNGIGKVAN